MLADGLALAIGVGREIDGVARLRRPFQIGNYLFIIAFLCVRNDLVVRLEIVIDVHAELAHRQILDMADRRHYGVIGPEIFVDRFGFGR